MKKQQWGKMLKIENLYAAYGKVEVLHGISLEVPAGKLVTLIGSNGAGKTTTMRSISGMLKPKSGTISLDGKNITGLTRIKLPEPVWHTHPKVAGFFQRCQ
jgi:branched-chain amino acid transport system ATP-binding protein